MMQRPERVVYLGAGALIVPMFAYFLLPVAHKWYPELTIAQFESYLYALPLTMVAIFCNTTSIHRIVNIMKLLKKKEFET